MGDQKFVEGQLGVMYKFDQQSGIAGAGVEAGMGVGAGVGGEQRGMGASGGVGEWPWQRQLKWWDGGGQGELTGRYQGQGWELEVVQELELELEAWEQEQEPEAQEQEWEPKAREQELGGWELEGQGNGWEQHHPPPITPTRQSGTRGCLIQSSSSSSGEESEGMEMESDGE